MARKSTKTNASSKNVAKAIETDTNNNAAPAVIPINADAKTFFDLPGEIRNQIYTELLPDAPDLADAPWDQDGLRSDGLKTSMTFMPTCKAVYEEASSLLCDLLATKEDALRMRIDRNDEIFFLNRRTKIEDATPANVAILKRVKKPSLYVSTS